MELLLSKTRLCTARETVRFKTDFLFAKKKSLVFFCVFFFFFSTETASAVLCSLDHTLYDLGSHSIPNCKLPPGPVTFFTQFFILPLVSPTIQDCIWLLRKTFEFHICFMAILVFICFYFTCIHTCSFPLISLLRSLSALVNILEAQVSLCQGRKYHSFTYPSPCSFTHSLFFEHLLCVLAMLPGTRYTEMNNDL